MTTQAHQAHRHLAPLGYGRGALAGLIGGIVMAIVAMMITAVMGMGLWAMPNMIAGIFMGPGAAMAGGPVVTIVGLMVHMMLSVIFGLIYAFIVNAWTHEIWATGFLYGLALWIFNYYIIGLALAGARMMAERQPVWLAVLLHLIFGGVTAWVARPAPTSAAAGTS